MKIQIQKIWAGTALLFTFAAGAFAEAKDAQITGYGISAEILWEDAPWNPAGLPADGDSVTINTFGNSNGSKVIADGLTLTVGSTTLNGFTNLNLTNGTSYTSNGGITVTVNAGMLIDASTVNIDASTGRIFVGSGGKLTAANSTINGIIRTVGGNAGSSVSLVDTTVDARSYAGTGSILDGQGNNNTYLFDNAKLYAANSAAGWRDIGFYGSNTNVTFTNGSCFRVRLMCSIQTLQTMLRQLPQAGTILIL